MTSKTSITYGGALYDLAKDEDLSAQILADLGAFAAVFRENPDYRRLLTEPSIPKAEREALLDEAWKDALHPYTLNFVKLLCANGTVSQLPDCETVYRARYNEDNNILAVTAVSAAPMREELQEKMDILDTECHIIRLGTIAIASNPFELFLDYGNQIKARSYAEQTFLIQLANGTEGYLPTEKAEKGGHYSAFLASGLVGHAGGEQLVRETLKNINKLFAE